MRTPSPQNKQNLLLTSTQYTNQLILNKIKATEFFHYSPFTSTQPQLFKEGSPIFIWDTHSCCFLWEKPNMRIYPDIFGCLSKYQLAKWAKQYEHPTLIFYFYFIFPGSSSKWRKRSLVLKTWSITKIGSWRLCHRWVGAKIIFLTLDFFIIYECHQMLCQRIWNTCPQKLPKTCPPMFCTKRN